MNADAPFGPAGQEAPALAAGMTRGEAVATLRGAFAAAGIENAALDARLLAAASLEIDGTALLVHPGTPLDGGGADRLAAFARRRLAREPVARILGRAEFWGLPFELGAETLVPRPDTETLVAAALARVPDRSASLSLLDLGTGSGCILIALLRELPAAAGIGIDASVAALGTARLNARRNHVADRALFVASDWGGCLAGPYDLVLSNPPYIRAGDIPGLDPEVRRHDPPAALDGGADGLAALRRVLGDAARLLAPSGRAIVEIGHDQAEDATLLAAARGLSVEDVARDLGGQCRALVLRPAAAGLRF